MAGAAGAEAKLVVPAGGVPVVAEGAGRFTDGLVGTAEASALVDGLGLIQLSQLPPVPVLLHPVIERQGKLIRPAQSQARQVKKTRMANSSFLEQVRDIPRPRP